MTEQQWLKGRRPGPLLDCLEGLVSPRKSRLFACAVGRLLPPLRSVAENRERGHAISVAERFADGQADLKELLGVSKVSAGWGSGRGPLPAGRREALAAPGSREALDLEAPAPAHQ
jgi:hypothetical protein